MYSAGMLEQGIGNIAGAPLTSRNADTLGEGMMNAYARGTKGTLQA